MTDPSLHFDEDAAAFARQGFVDLGVVLKGPELKRFQDLYPVSYTHLTLPTTPYV